MPNYVRIAGTDIYLRVFEQSDVSFITGTATANMVVDFDLERDFADAREVCGSDVLPTTKHYFTFEGQKTTVSNQAVWQASGSPIIWGMWGATGAETIHLALLRGGFKPSSNAMNYYLPLVTCDGVLFESTNQSTAYMPVSELTLYENNQSYVEPDEPERGETPEVSSNMAKIIAFALRKAGVPMAEMVAMMLCRGGGTVTPDEPVIPGTLTGYLYGHVAEADETPDVYIDGVGYVGVVASELPEWDEDEYPYAMIVHSTTLSKGYWFLLFDSQPTIDDAVFNYPRSADKKYLYNTESGTWDESKMSNYLATARYTWSNYDLYDWITGKLVIAATEPIPVYSGGSNQEAVLLSADGYTLTDVNGTILTHKE